MLGEGVLICIMMQMKTKYISRRHAKLATDKLAGVLSLRMQEGI